MLENSAVREPLSHESDLIYKMGFDAWAQGSSLEDYLATCRASLKYRRNEWRVLDHPAYGLLSSLLIHRFQPASYGIGSIATAPEMRKMGCASLLTERVVKDLEEKRGAEMIFLYSDIDPGFYRRFDFGVLPRKSQKYPNSICMVRLKHGSPKRIEDLLPPDYF